ncbi:PREDICTED: superoxide dismutase [Mn], mitochondrial-like [Rhagoletis zephyria]|uniref:superoxide dismutase [Mn], mitochondrial n=1 Tax=Rhagoletis zephyria TaxID=28612 RepID=UPI0008112ABE|nr:PREDICTED: superoxide dismutase [Mn], mitochondrial [Rhagoletis zephyria]XP_017481451.1 PREDICTED: superoxide dismutase [Mn], mitochondrial-like [Rhagoletis zephyria]XP_036334038.1 superoxide dismutase [Mn], mitochondrial [Rhagoletis pomonella]
MFSLARTASNVAKTAVRCKHDLPKLPYDYAALEPIICREIMELHHQKHHQTYVNNLNAAEEQLAEAQQKKDVTKIISLAPALRFNGGGHINHSIFWHNLSPEKSQPSNDLKSAIEAQFGSLDALKKELTTLTVAVQGSGWGWLGYNKKTNQLQLAALPNQDPLEGSTGLIPLFGIDVWEHAYYLQYKNVRPSYVEAIWDIANWKDISNRFAAASKK